MTIYTHDPSLLSHADGFVLANAATTGGAAGWVLTCALSGDGVVTYQSGAWRSTGTTGVARLDGTITSAAIVSTEILFDLGAVPGADSRILEIRHASNYAMRFNHRTTGNLRLLDAANATAWTSTGTYTGIVRLHLAIQPGTGTGDGKVRINVYTDATTTTAAETWTSDTSNMGTSPIVQVRVGSIGAVSDTVTTLNVRAKDDDLTPLGPLAALPVPNKVAVVTRTTNNSAIVTQDAEIDYTASTNTTSLNVTSVSGPADFDVLDVNVTGLVLTFVDNPARVIPTVINVDVIGPGGTVSDTVTLSAMSTSNIATVVRGIIVAGAPVF